MPMRCGSAAPLEVTAPIAPGRSRSAPVLPLARTFMALLAQLVSRRDKRCGILAVSWSGFRRTWSLGDPKDYDDRAKANPISVGEPMRDHHSMSANVGAVLASEILEGGRVLPNDNPGVVTGDTRGVDPHGGVYPAPQ